MHIHNWARPALLLAALILCTACYATAAQRPTIVVIDFALQDDMVPGPGGKAPGGDAVRRRTDELAEYVEELLQESSKYALVALDRASPEYQTLRASSGRIFDCKRCIATFGRDVGSDYVLHGWVQRVSNLIINFNIEIIESKTGKVYDRASVDTRGNTDKSWRDGASFLVRHLNHGL